MMETQMWNTTSREIVNNIIDSITSNIVRHGVVRRKNGEEEVDEGKDVVEGEEVEEGIAAPPHIALFCEGGLPAPPVFATGVARSVPPLRQLQLAS